MRPHKLWDWVGPPTWKRSGTLVFSAVMGVLLVGGTAMAANLGLLTFTASGDRGHRLEVPRPPLSVTLPTTESAPPIVDSTSAAEDVEETDVDGDDDGTNDSRTDEGSTTENPEDESDDGMEPTSDQADDDADDDDDDDDSNEDESDDDDEARSERESDERGRHRAESDESGRKARAFGANGDGRLDDD